MIEIEPKSLWNKWDRRAYDKAYKERHKERYKLYYQNNKERLKEYYLKNKEHLKEYQKKWCLKNKEQKKSVTYVDINAEDTVDEKIVKALRKKVNIASEVMGEELKAWI